MVEDGKCLVLGCRCHDVLDEFALLELLDVDIVVVLLEHLDVDDLVVLIKLLYLDDMVVPVELVCLDVLDVVFELLALDVLVCTLLLAIFLHVGDLIVVENQSSS